MVRTTAEARIQLGKQMVETWTAAGHGNNRSCLFVKDMLDRMSYGKGLSPKQREWYDAVVVTPPPETKNKDKVEAIRSAAKVEGLKESDAQTLNDFARRLGNGWSLSDKQVVFMDSLLQKAEKLRTEGPWIPTDEEKAAILQGLNFTKRYNQYYLANRPGLGRAAAAAIAWHLQGRPIDKKDAEVLMNICKGEKAAMKKFAKKYPVGSLVNDDLDRAVLVMSAPYPRDFDGHVVINAMVDGKVTEIFYRRIKQAIVVPGEV